MSTRVDDRSTPEKPKRAPRRSGGGALHGSAVPTSKGLGKLVRARSAAETQRLLIDQVRQGLPFRQLESLASELGLSTNRLSEDYLHISRATLTRRRQSGRLRPDESDKVVRFARLWRLVVDLMEGDEDAARRWLCAPLPVLANESPLEYAGTEIGAHELEQLIGRLAQGVFS